MRSFLRYLLTTVVGAALGVGLAIHTVRAGALGSNVRVGPWVTGRDFGTADAGTRTRAVVALRGLLALPAREARYYTAAIDDAGQPLDGRCTYTVSGGSLPARWWSLTLYDRNGYLAGPGPYSVESAALLRRMAEEDRTRAIGYVILPPHGPGRWDVLVGPKVHADLPTAGLDQFELTLRTYLPPNGGKGDPPRAGLPSITREGC